MNSEQSIIVELLSHQELNKFQEFIRKFWKKDHLFVEETSVFDWQHKESYTYNCMKAKKGGSLVGVQTFIPQNHFDHNLSDDQIFLTLWAVTESQGIGVGLRLFKKIISEFKPRFIGVVGINDRLIPFHKWQGFKVGIMNHSVALSPYHNSFKVAKVPLNYKIKGGIIDKEITYKKITIEDLKRSETDDIFSYQWPTKSVNYVINRYLKHPTYSYDIFALYKNENLLALFVLRPISKYDRTVLRIIDYYGSNETISSSYVFIKDVLKKYNAEYLDMYSFGVSLDALEDAGLMRIQNGKELIIPNYFEPFLRENINIAYAYKAEHHPHPPIRLFKGDGDQDRPSQINGEN
jgi:hypothetical protein